MVSHFYFRRLELCFSDLNMVHEWQIACRFFVILRFYCWQIFFDIQLHAAEEIEQRRESQNKKVRRENSSPDIFILSFSSLFYLFFIPRCMPLTYHYYQASGQYLVRQRNTQTKHSFFVTSAGLGLSNTGGKRRVSLTLSL